ncbi:MAG: epoxyqueuosine reductase QueH [Desulfotalea sp.]
MKKILLHSCCGPCSIYPVAELRKQGFIVTSFFYNHNIHPFKEFRRRLNTVEEFAKREKIKFIAERNYLMRQFLQDAVFNENKRCNKCYYRRLEETARYASENNFESFTTTLLYSKYQNHSVIVSQCQKLATKYGLEFYYSDFREGWQEGIDQSIAQDMYRQPYCGCIYSEQERYDKRFRKSQLKEEIDNGTDDSACHKQSKQS